MKKVTNIGKQVGRFGVPNIRPYEDEIWFFPVTEGKEGKKEVKEGKISF